MSAKAPLVAAFNNHLAEFIDDVCTVFPENADLAAARQSFAMVRKVNPRMVASMWYTNVTVPYEAPIAAGDIDYFLSKTDYGADLAALPEELTAGGKVLNVIDRLRGPVQAMGPTNHAKAIQYIQNLTRLAKMAAGP